MIDNDSYAIVWSLLEDIEKQADELAREVGYARDSLDRELSMIDADEEIVDIAFDDVDYELQELMYEITNAQREAEDIPAGAYENHSEFTTCDIKNCARCGGCHDSLRFDRLERPNDEWCAWAPCPNNGQPIMMAEVDV